MLSCNEGEWVFFPFSPLVKLNLDAWHFPLSPGWGLAVPRPRRLAGDGSAGQGAIGRGIRLFAVVPPG